VWHDRFPGEFLVFTAYFFFFAGGSPVNCAKKALQLKEVDDDDIVDRLARIFKDMPPYTACPVPEYSAARPPK
jgi:hypothetical protein